MLPRGQSRNVCIYMGSGNCIEVLEQRRELVNSWRGLVDFGREGIYKTGNGLVDRTCVRRYRTYLSDKLASSIGSS